MSISKKMMAGMTAVAFALASVSALAQDRPGARYDDRRDDRYDDRYDDSRYDRDAGYDYAKVIDVQPLTTRVRVTTPARECWDESRVDDRTPRASAGGAILGAVIGGVIGHQIGSGRGRDAATAAGAVIGAGVGARQAERRAGNVPREYTVQRCDTRYSEHWEERVDAYRVTYVYHGRRQVTELPYNPGDRIRVRVDVRPAY